MKKSINRIAFFNFLSVLILQGISLISSPLFSRLLGTSGYGNLASFMVWTNLATTILSLQSNMTLVNARQEFPEEEQLPYQSSAMAMTCLSFLIGSGLIFFFAEPISQALQMDRLLLVMMVVQAFGGFCVNFLSSKFTYEFKAEQHMLLSVLMAIARLGVSLLLVLSLPVQQRFFGRVLGNVLVFGAVGLVSCIHILRKGGVLYSRRYWKFCFALGLPLVFQSLAYTILEYSDVLMLKQMAGDSQSGVYSLAFTLSGILFTLFNALNTSWTPFFFEDMKNGKRENVVRQSRNFTELFAVLCIGFILLVREVYKVYADESFWPGVEMIALFAANYFVTMLCTFPVNYEILHKKTKTVAAATVASAVANLVMNYIFIRLFGMMGAAVATLLARILQLVIHECYSRLSLGKEDYPFPMADGLKGCAAVTAAVILFYVTTNAWYIRWPLGAALGLWELLRMWKRKSLL